VLLLLIMSAMVTIGESLTSEPYLIPGIPITYFAYNKLVSYLKSTQLLKAKFIFQGSHIGMRVPTRAGFSSRGPNLHSIYVLMPDIIASGVDILLLGLLRSCPLGCSWTQGSLNSTSYLEPVWHAHMSLML